MSKSAAEGLLEIQLKAAKISYEREVQPIEGRKFRYDFECWSCGKTLRVEIQGGVYLAKGGHNTGGGITRDCTKIGLSIAQGIPVLPVTTAQVKQGLALQWIESYLLPK